MAFSTSRFTGRVTNNGRASYCGLAAGFVPVLLAALLAGCSPSSDPDESHSPRAAAKADRSKPAGEPVLKLDVETQQRLHLKVTVLAAAKRPVEPKAYGRVLDPAPLAGLMLDLASARVELTNSELELRRLETLHGQDNASTRALQAAQAAAEKDRLAVESVRERLLLGWGPALAERENLAGLARALSRRESLILRLEAPAGEGPASLPTGARFQSFAGEGGAAEAEFLGAAPTTDPQTQGRGFLFLVKSNLLQLSPGAAVIGFLKVAAPPLEGVLLPGSAVVRHEGQAWAYVQDGNESFHRQSVSVEHWTGDGWLVTEGLHPDERVVIEGAQTLLSEELKTRIRVGD